MERTLAAFLLFAVVLSAHDPITTKITWAEEISRIVYKHCASCHRDGGEAFSLTTYDEARPWAKAIRDQVLQRRMPPWGAAPGIAYYRDDPSLTPAEMDMVVNWVEGGAPEGDAAFLPHRKSFQPMPANGPVLGIEVRTEFVTTSPLILTGVRPVGLDSGKSMEVTAYLPGGEARHLIWLKDYRKEWTRTYVFREPMLLPKGTHVRVFCDSGAKIVLVKAAA
ncbi:MAG: cytochrome c [Acidobacteriota bacterium]|nr:cytochrome c [Acidobacteriota bacterium]